jgi:hypothetical protein
MEAIVSSERLSDGSDVFCVHVRDGCGNIVKIDAKNEDAAHRLSEAFALCAIDILVIKI